MDGHTQPPNQQSAVKQQVPSGPKDTEDTENYIPAVNRTIVPQSDLTNMQNNSFQQTGGNFATNDHEQDLQSAMDNLIRTRYDGPEDPREASIQNRQPSNKRGKGHQSNFHDIRSGGQGDRSPGQHSVPSDSMNHMFDEFSRESNVSKSLSNSRQIGLGEINSPDIVTDAKPSQAESRHVVEQTPLFEENTYGPDEFLDASIVYAKADYDAVDKHFIPWLKSLLDSHNVKGYRIVRYDDNVFPPHNLEGMEKIFEKSMLILMYLTQNFNNKDMTFFTNEAVNNTRLFNPNELLHYVMQEQKKWAVRPVHTQPEKSRRYKTPMGLGGVYGIDYFQQKSMTLTYRNTVKMIKDAMNSRQRAELYQSTYSNSTGYIPQDSMAEEEKCNYPTLDYRTASLSLSYVDQKRENQEWHGSCKEKDKSSRVLTPPSSGGQRDQTTSSRNLNSSAMANPAHTDSVMEKTSGPNPRIGNHPVTAETKHENETANSVVITGHATSVQDSHHSVASHVTAGYQDRIPSTGNQVSASCPQYQPQDGDWEDAHKKSEDQTGKDGYDEEDSYKPDTSLVMDAQPSLEPEDVKATQVKQTDDVETTKKYGSKITSSEFEVREDTVTHYGQAQRATAPCASEPEVQESEIEQGCHGNTAVKDQSVHSSDKKERVITREIHHHYYHGSPADKKKKNDVKMINISGCAVVQIGDKNSVISDKIDSRPTDTTQEEEDEEEEDTNEDRDYQGRQSQSEGTAPPTESQNNLSLDAGNTLHSAPNIPVSDTISFANSDEDRDDISYEEEQSTAEALSDEDNSMAPSETAVKTTTDILDDMLPNKSESDLELPPESWTAPDKQLQSKSESWTAPGKQLAESPCNHQVSDDMAKMKDLSEEEEISSDKPLIKIGTPGKNTEERSEHLMVATLEVGQDSCNTQIDNNQPCIAEKCDQSSVTTEETPTVAAINSTDLKDRLPQDLAASSCRGDDEVRDQSIPQSFSESAIYSMTQQHQGIVRKVKTCPVTMIKSACENFLSAQVEFLLNNDSDVD